MDVNNLLTNQINKIIYKLTLSISKMFLDISCYEILLNNHIAFLIVGGRTFFSNTKTICNELSIVE